MYAPRQGLSDKDEKQKKDTNVRYIYELCYERESCICQVLSTRPLSGSVTPGST